MNSTLSTLIAFSGFLMIFSVLVTSVQEALKNWLKLKTSVWETFFTQLYEKKFKTTLKPGKTQKYPMGIIPAIKNPRAAYQEKIKEEFIGEFDERIERLYNVVEKADKIFAQLSEDMNSILQHSVTIKRIENVIGNAKFIKALNLDRFLKLFDSYGKSDFKRINDKLDAFEKLAGKYIGNPALPAVEQQIKDSCKELQQVLVGTKAEIEQYKINFDLKKEAWLEQIKYSHKRNMLKWTFGIGLLFVLFFNADAFSIYKHLQAHPDLQDTVTEQSLNLNMIRYRTNPDDLNAIDNRLELLNKNGQMENDVLKALLADLLNFSNSLLEDYNIYKIDSSGISSIIEALNKIEPENSTPELIKSLNALYGSLNFSYINFQKSVIKNMTYQVTTGLPLGWKKDIDSFGAPGTNKIWFIVSKCGGLLLTALLISFGAPFWKNTLNALVGIKKGTPIKHNSKS